MKSVSVRELKHDTTTVLSWVGHGESVEVRRRGKPVAMLVPRKGKRSKKLPDFAARIRAAYGRGVSKTTGTELVSELRG